MRIPPKDQQGVFTQQTNTLEGTNISPTIEDAYPFAHVGYASSLEGTVKTVILRCEWEKTEKTAKNNWKSERDVLCCFDKNG